VNGAPGRTGRGDAARAERGARAAGGAILPRLLGWYGKLPSHGDFVGHGLPRRWQQAWDGWLQRVLAIAAQRLGGKALDDHLLGMPVWQALVLPQRRGDAVWSGIVAGSSDRVGRAFPLLVAESWDARAVGALRLEALHGRALLLAHALDDAQQLDRAEFEERLGALGSTPLVDAADGASTLDGLRAAHPAAASFWWRSAHRLDAWPQPAAEPWPPGDGLLDRLLGLDGGAASGAVDRA
jgi:type VI secretion system protein ImpM